MDGLTGGCIIGIWSRIVIRFILESQASCFVRYDYGTEDEVRDKTTGVRGKTTEWEQDMLNKWLFSKRHYLF